MGQRAIDQQIRRGPGQEPALIRQVKLFKTHFTERAVLGTRHEAVLSLSHRNPHFRDRKS
jgi:hypothetical protein